MALRAEIIPGTILKAAQRVGLTAPDWYVGRTNGHEKQVAHVTLDEIVEQAKQPAEKPQGSGDLGESQAG